MFTNHVNEFACNPYYITTFNSSVHPGYYCNNCAIVYKYQRVIFHEISLILRLALGLRNKMFL